MPNTTKFVQLTRHGDAEITIGGASYLAQFTPGGVQLTPQGGGGAGGTPGEPLVIPWAVLGALPVAYRVVVDGWLHPARYDSERDALDKATDLRATGCRADVVRVPRTA